MAVKSLNSIDGFSVGSNGNVIIDGAGNITTASITVSTFANLGNVGNVKIYGGSTNQVLSTDGAGNLSWVNQGTGTTIVAAYMPYIINTGEIYLVPENRQGLFSVPIDIGDGTLEVDGILVEV